MGCFMGTKAREENHCRAGVKSGLARDRATTLTKTSVLHLGRPIVRQTSFAPLLT